MQEGCVRAYHMMAPLLGVKRKSPMLLSGLAAIHVALQVQDLRSLDAWSCTCNSITESFSQMLSLLACCNQETHLL